MPATKPSPSTPVSAIAADAAAADAAPVAASAESAAAASAVGTIEDQDYYPVYTSAYMHDDETRKKIASADPMRAVLTEMERSVQQYSVHVVEEMGTWARLIAAIREQGKRRPWAQRDPRVLWRGKILGQFKDCTHNYTGNYNRLQAATLTVTNPGEVDVKCVGECTPRNASNACPATELYDATMSRITGNTREIPSAGNMRQDDYRSLLNLPGATTGSYSRNLNHLWFSGSVIFQWDVKFVEWLYPAMTSGRTHVLTDRRRLVDQVRSLNSKYDRTLDAETLRRGASRIGETLMTPEGINTYMRATLNAIRGQFQQQAILDDACAARDFFTEFPRFFHANTTDEDYVVAPTTYDLDPSQLKPAQSAFSHSDDIPFLPGGFADIVNRMTFLCKRKLVPGSNDTHAERWLPWLLNVSSPSSSPGRK